MLSMAWRKSGPEGRCSLRTFSATQSGFAAGALALEFAVEVAFGTVELAGEALEGFFLVDSGLGLKAGDAVGYGFPGSLRRGGEGLGRAPLRLRVPE